MGIGRIKITYVLPELITNNITKKSLRNFAKDLDEEDYMHGCNLNRYISKLINERRLTKRDFNNYLFKELFYGQQKDIYIHKIYSFNSDIISELNLSKIIESNFEEKSTFCKIAETVMKNICEKQELVAYRVKKDIETEEVYNIKMIFLCEVERLNNKGDIIEEYSYIPIELDLSKMILICKVAPKTNLTSDEYKPSELYGKYIDKIINMFDIKIDYYNTSHKTALYNMSESLYNQIYQKMVSTRNRGLDELIDKFVLEAKTKVNIENIDKKISINNLFNIKSYLKKYFDQLQITDILSRRDFKIDDREDIKGIVTYLRFNDGTNVSAKVKGENFKSSIYTSETYMALRDTIENANKISEMNVIWILEDKDLRVKYNTNSGQYLFMHFYKDFEEGDFLYGYRKYKEYESMVISTTNELVR